MKHPEIWESVRTLMKFRNQAPKVVPVERNGNIPLSFPQERLWLLEQLNPGSADYNVPYAFRVKGKLDVPALEQSLNEIRSRHEPLRTTFESVDGQGVQVIAPTTPSLTLTVVDLQELPERDREAKALALVKEEAKSPFDIKRSPLFRTSLLKLAEEDHIVLITLHHIIYDAWSDGILFLELTTLYEDFTNGNPSSLPELPIQYADFAVWQRQWLQGEFLETLLNFWKQELEGLPMPKLPTDRPRPAVASGKRSRQALVLPKTLTEQLNVFTSSEGVTPFITLLAAFNVLLHCYMGQEDIFLCSPIANRNRKEIQKQIGYFVNLLVYRNDLSGNPSFKELLSRVRQASARAYTHQDLPIQLLASELNLVNVPLSQVLFALQNVVLQSPKLGNLAITPLEEQRGTDFDLFMSMEEAAGELTAVLKYNTDLFDHATITQMLQHFQTILENIVANPEQPISKLLPLNEAQQQQLQQKLDRQASTDPGQTTSQENKIFVAPKDPLELQLTQIWEQVLGIAPIGVTDNFFEIGGKSLLAIRLFNQIEEQFHKKLPLATLVKAPTIEQLANILRQEELEIPWQPVVTLQARGTKPPLFLLPPAACTALHYAEVARHLAPDQPVYGLEQLGMDGKYAPHTTVEEMASYYIEQIQAIQPEGPYLLGGRCMGGIVAFEMALQLQTQGQKVAMLAILDTQSPPRLKRRDLSYYISEFFKRLRRIEFFLALVRRFLKKAKLLVSGNDQDRQIQTVLDTHKIARRNYIPQQVFAGTLDLFKNSEASLDAQSKWTELASEPINWHLIEGDHETMLEEPHVREFAQELKASIDRSTMGDREADPKILSRH